MIGMTETCRYVFRVYFHLCCASYAVYCLVQVYHSCTMDHNRDE